MIGNFWAAGHATLASEIGISLKQQYIKLAPLV